MTMVMKAKGKNEKRIKASEFKAKCLALMDEVHRSGEEIIVTKNGNPVVRVVSAAKIRKPWRLGENLGEMEILGDIVSPVDRVWALSPSKTKGRY